MEKISYDAVQHPMPNKCLKYMKNFKQSQKMIFQSQMENKSAIDIKWNIPVNFMGNAMPPPWKDSPTFLERLIEKKMPTEKVSSPDLCMYTKLPKNSCPYC